MASTGIPYFYELLGLGNQVLAAFSFNNSGIHFGSDYGMGGSPGSVVPANAGAASTIFSSYGSGLFDENSTRHISIDDQIGSEDWTMFLAYERTGIKEHTLVSSYENKHGGPSGFSLGINEANKVFLEYYNNVEGLQTVTFSGIIPSKNILCVTKNDAAIRINYFDPNSESFISQSFDVFQNNFVDSSSWSVGGKSGYFDKPSFGGYIDEFLLLDGILIEDFAEILCSGYYATKNPDTLNVVSVCSDVTVMSGVALNTSSGIVGYESYITSQYVDVCNRLHRIYAISGVSGVISGSVFVPVITSVCQDVTGIVKHGYNVNSGFLSSLGMEGVSSLMEIDSYDSSFYGFNTKDVHDLSKNKEAQFDLANSKFFMDRSYSFNEFDLFLNGQLQLFSGYLAYQSGYQQLFELSGDYITSGIRLESMGYFLTPDSLIYDVSPSVSRSSKFVSGVSSGDSFAGFNFNDKLVYFNGQLLESGNQYSFPNTLNINIEGLGLLTTVGRNSSSQYFYKDSGNFLNSDKFLRGTSQAWVNGVRLDLSTDYVEISNVDLLDGAYYNSNGDIRLYKNTNDFFNV